MSRTDWRAEAVREAESVVAGNVSPLDGARQLTDVGHMLTDEFWSDPDFSVLGSVETQTDDLPFGAVRAHWNARALVRKDRQIAEWEAAVRDAVLAACRSIMVRYSRGQP